MTLTDEQIREMCENATAGPWLRSKFGFNVLTGDSEVSIASQRYTGSLTDASGQMKSMVSNAEFIVASRELVPQLLERAQRAEAELRRCYTAIEELTAERTDQKAMLADAGLRNAVLQTRVDKLLDMCTKESWAYGCPTEPAHYNCIVRIEGYGGDKSSSLCEKCWRDYAIKQLEAVQP